MRLHDMFSPTTVFHWPTNLPSGSTSSQISYQIGCLPTGERRVSPAKPCPEGKATAGLSCCWADGSELFSRNSGLVVVWLGRSCVSLSWGRKAPSFTTKMSRERKRTGRQRMNLAFLDFLESTIENAKSLKKTETIPVFATIQTVKKRRKNTSKTDTERYEFFFNILMRSTRSLSLPEMENHGGTNGRQKLQTNLFFCCLQNMLQPLENGKGERTRTMMSSSLGLSRFS